MTSMLVAGVAAPLVISALLLLLIRRDWGWPLALASAFAAAHWGLVGLPDFPPVDVTHWLPYLALIGALVGVFTGVLSDFHLAHWLTRILVVAGGLWILLSPLIENRWTAKETGLWLTLLAFLWLLLWASLSRLSDRLTPVELVLILLPTVTATSLVLLLSYSALLGQLGGALAAALGAGLVVVLLVVCGESFALGVPVTAILLGGLWLSGLFYAEMPRESAALLWLSPAGAWVAMLQSMRTRPMWKRAGLAALLVGVIGGAAVIVAYQATDSLGY